MKYYLIALLAVIMGAGARTMFEVARKGALHDTHDTVGFGPDTDTIYLIFLIIWFLLMMIADVLLLNYTELNNRIVYIALLSVGVLVPTVYMAAFR